MNALVTGGVYNKVDGTPIAGATVRLLNFSSGYSRIQTTDAKGNYIFNSVGPGKYIISVEASGYETSIVQNQDVTVGDEMYVRPPVFLQPASTAKAEAKPEMNQPAAAQAPEAKPPETAAAPATSAPAPSESKPNPPPQAAANVTPPSSAASAAAPPAGVPAAVSHAESAPTVSLDFLNTETGGVISSQLIRTLPLANRDFFNLALLVPGTYPVEQSSALAGASIVVNGVRANMNNFLLDGADDNDYTINQSLPFQIVEAMQEFRVQTGNSPAEFGRNGGAQVNTISRSGSNALHGTLFEFNRNSALSSQNALSLYRGGTFDAFAQETRVVDILNGPQPYDPATGTGTFFPNSAMSDPALSKIFNDGRNVPLNQNQFGGNIGGPIKKDKAFFFFNWESFRAANDRPVMERVPDSTCRNDVTCSMINSGAAPEYPVSTGLVSSLFSLYPEPNVPQSTVTNAFGKPLSDPSMADSFFSGANPAFETGAFYAGQAKNFTDSDNFLERIDLVPSDRVSMSFKHNLQDINQVQAGSLPANGNYPGSGFNLTGRNQNFSFNLVNTLSPNTVNEFRAGWNRFRLGTLPLDHTFNASSIFENLNFANQGLPTIMLGGVGGPFGPYANLGSDFSAPSNRADNVWSVADNLSHTWGRHIVKFGGEFRYNRLDVDNLAAGRGLVTFYDVPFPQSNGQPDLASIARVSPDFGGGFDRSFRARAFDWFVQDTWRPRSNVALNLGVRYEYNQAPFEARNRLVNDYPGACGAGSIVCLIRPGTNTMMSSDGTILGQASFTAPRAGFNSDTGNFAPRVGLAWDLRNNGETVFRAGYSLMYDQQSLEPSVNMLLNPPYVQQAMSLSTLFTLGDTFPAGFPLNFKSPSGLSGVEFANLRGDNFNGGNGSIWFAQPYSITARDPNSHTPYVEQYFASLEQRLGNNAMVALDYIGSSGRRLPRNRLLQQCTAGVFLSDAIDCLPHVFGSLFPGTGAGTASDAVVYQENSGSSNFNSLLARFDTAEFHGFTFHVHYQWAHSIDNGSSAVAPVFLLSPTAAVLVQYLGDINPDQFAALNNVNPTLSLRPGLPIVSTQPLLPNDTSNSALLNARGNSDFDVRQRLVFYYTYDIPKWAPRIGSGWQVAGITSIESGQPFTVFGNYFGVPLRPNQAGAVPINNGNPNGAIDNALPAGCNNFTICTGTSGVSAFDPSPFLNFMPGSLPRNNFTGPKLVDTDFSIIKNIGIGSGERVRAQIRVEFFNLFNNPNYRQPFSQTGQAVGNIPLDASTTIPGYLLPNPFFGEILQAGEPRQIQFGLKLLF